MQFGYGLLTAQRPPSSGRTYEEVYDESIRLAQLAEDQGFNSVWTSEHHFFDDGYSPSVLPLSAALATATDSIGIGTGIALAPLYDPIRLAEDAATIDNLSGGRFTLGLANGYMQREFDAFGVPKSERANRVNETIDICQRAWDDGSFSYQGDVFECEDLRVEPTPVQDSGPPILLGGTSEPAVRRAARKADGHIGVVYYPEDFSEKGSFTEVKQNVDTIASKCDPASDDFTVSIMQYAHVAEDADDAWETQQPALVYSRRKYAEHADSRDASEWESEALTDERLDALRRGSLVGEPETVVERLREYERELPGEVLFIARLWHPTFSFEEHAEAIELFGSEVIPEFG